MKKLKIKKCMTSFLMLAVMIISIIGVMPKTVAFASTFSYTMEDGVKTDKSITNTYSWSPIGGSGLKYYVAYYTGHSRITFFAISKGESFKINATALSNGENMGTNKVDCNGYVTVDGVKYYYFSLGYAYPNPTNGVDFYNFKWSGASGVCFYSENHSDDEFVTYFLTGKFPDDCDFNTTMTSTTDGSQDNPMEDKDIGTIVLKSHGFIPTKNDNFIGDVSASYDYYFKYKDKTSSGFSISDNKYARTFIQVRVQNQCVLFEPGHEDTVKEYYPHYGEFYQYKNLATENISNNTVKVSWGDVMLKWSDFTEHPLAINKKLAYRFMLRVICTDSLTVVPDKSSGWYAGGWRSFIFDGDKFLEETNGHVDGDGNWSDDEDDGYNDSSDKTTNINQDKDDVDGRLNDDSSDSGSSSKLNISNIKAFMKEVGNVPKAIGKLFSFLPDWVTTFIGFGFVVLVALIIIKAIRG